MAIYVSHHVQKESQAAGPIYTVLVNYTDDQKSSDYRATLTGALADAVVHAPTQADAEAAALAGVQQMMAEAAKMTYPAEAAAQLVSEAKAQVAALLTQSAAEVQRRADAITAAEQQSAANLAAMAESLKQTEHAKSLVELAIQMKQVELAAVAGNVEAARAELASTIQAARDAADLALKAKASVPPPAPEGQ